MNHLPSAVRRSPAWRRPIALAAGIASSSALLLVAAVPAHAAGPVTTFEAQDAATAAASLVGEHVTLRSAALTAGRAVQAATFAGIDSDIADGLALSTGSLRAADPNAAGDVDFTASSLSGPNAKLTTTGDLGGAGSAALEASFGATTYDAAELTLEVVPAGNSLSIDYQIGSEEYAGWAERDYVDAFAVYVGGTLCSLVGDQPVGVATVNAASHADLFVSNLTADGAPGTRGTELNGFSKQLTCTVPVTPGAATTIVAAVADTVDGQLDSTLMLSARGITSVPGPSSPEPTPTTAPTAPTDGGVPSATPVPAAVIDAAGGGSSSGARGSLPRTGLEASGVIAAGVLAAGAIAAGATAIVTARRRAAREVIDQ